MRPGRFSQTQRLSRVLIGAITLVAFIVSLSAVAQSEIVLHVFTGSDGDRPYAGLVFDAAGNLYGTTYAGGANGFGTVFELSPPEDGGIETVLYSFTGGVDGANPYAGLIFDKAGNLYGTTNNGGLPGGCYGAGCGVVFELSPAGSVWQEKVLYTFSGGSDGSNAGYPDHDLIFDAAGNLYGTTPAGGPVLCGTVFKLSPTESGEWNETVLYGFDGPQDYTCANPSTGVIFDATGNLYGATFDGGFGYGSVFQLSPVGGGAWNETLLYEFTGSDGVNPGGSLIFDAAGNLYGTTYLGGNLEQCGGNGCGVVFELSPTASGPWQQTLPHIFESLPRDGAWPTAGLVFDTAGNLYGTTTYGGDDRIYPHGYGTVFELSPAGGGNWNEKVLHFFTAKKFVEKGGFPYAPLIRDSKGRLYGTTAGVGNGAVVFRIRP